MAVTLQGAFLGILLPVFYSICVNLTSGPAFSEDVGGSAQLQYRIRSYLTTSDTLINISSAVWLTGIVLELALLGVRLTSAKEVHSVAWFYVIMAYIALCSCAMYIWLAILRAYQNDELRDYNLFCLTRQVELSARNLVSGALFILFLGAPALIALTFINAASLQTFSLPSGTESYLSGLMLSVISSVLMVFFWVLLGFIYQPFEAILILRGAHPRTD